MINILKFICLFIGVWFTVINLSKTLMKDKIPFANFFCQAVGIAGFIFIQWLV